MTGPRGWLVHSVFALLYAAAVGAGRATVVPDTQLSVLAPTAGVAAVWCAVDRRPSARALVAAAIAALAGGLSLATGAPWLDALGLGIANAVMALLFTWLMERAVPSSSATEVGDRLGVEGLGGIALRAVVAAALTAGIGPASYFELDADNLYVAIAWTLRNAVTVAALYPLGMLILARREAARTRSPEVAAASGAGSRFEDLGWWSRVGVVELVALLAVTTAACVAVFGFDDDYPVAFAVIATSVWAGSRFPPLVANGHAIAVGTTAALLTVHDQGLFAASDDGAVEAALVQAFIATALATSMTISLRRRAAVRLYARLHEAEQAARQQSRLMETILGATEEGVVVVDRDERVVLRNLAAVRLTGASTGTLPKVGDGLEFCRPDGTPVPAQDFPVRRALAGETVEAEDFVLRTRERPAGLVIELSALPLTSPDGQQLAVVLLRDVTAVRRERDELAAFAGVVAHDLLNPLTAVDGWSDALEDELAETPVDVERARAHLARVRRGSERMHALINDLLAYTTARSARITPTRVDLGSLVAEIVQQRSEAAVVGGVHPLITVEPLPEVRAEPVLVRQALDNLIGNALKYVAPGVVPQVLVTVAEGVDVPEGMVEIEVADNGIGIPAEQRASVFETFHRAHRDGAYKGTGLGLSIVKRIAERHGGSVVALENPRHPGTSIRLRLPLA